MRILVAGASGYLGCHIVERLANAGHDVTALVRSASKIGRWSDRANITVCEGTLEDAERVAHLTRGQDACVHAALIWGEADTDLELRDTVAAAKLFDACGRSGVSRTLFVSSTAVHRPFRTSMDEEDRLRCTDAYGATKAAGELFLWSACATHDMDGVVLRPGPIVGPPAFPGAPFRSPSRVERLLDAARRGEPIHVEGGSGRQLVAARDVADVIATLLESSRANETYLCADREVTSWKSIARRLVSLTGSTSPVVVSARSPSERNGGESMPRFDVGKLAEHLGIELTSTETLEAHLQYLVQNTDSAQES